MANRVFEDRVGLWVVDPVRGIARRSAIRAFGGGLIRDVFMPHHSTAAQLDAIREVGLYAHLWTAADGLSAADLAARTLADVARAKPGAVDLNVEGVPDLVLGLYCAELVARIRKRLRSRRLRIVLAPWKGFVVPYLPLATDRALYVCAENYGGNMVELYASEDVAHDLRAWGAPADAVTVMYAAHCRVLGSRERQRVLPDLRKWHRGVIFQDDLMADAGLL